MFDKGQLTEPLNSASAPLGPPARCLEWGSSQLAAPPTRQSSTSSISAPTVASESDLRYMSSPQDPRRIALRLERLKEQRGWKHYFLHVLNVPFAFVAGVCLGAALVAALLLKMGDSNNNLGGLQKEKLGPYMAVAPPEEVPALYLASPPLNNSCLIQNLAIPDGPQTFDACGFVVRSTDEVWNLRGNVTEAIEKYFHEDYLDAGSWGRRIIGKKALRDAVLAEMRAFPDIKIHITDCVCRGNDNDGYKCGMPDVLEGTNLGPSAYGPATNRYARWTGMVQSLVKKDEKTGQWQYWAEWGVHDEWALIQQLGLDFQRVPHPAFNWEPLHDCTPLQRFNPGPQLDHADVEDMWAHSSRVHR